MLSIKNLLLLFLALLPMQPKLVQVVSLFRHGARYQLNPLYDPGSMAWWGQLTAVGMRQHQTLGQLLKKEYIDNLGFLSTQYNRKQVEAFSTITDRTVQSAMCQLEGFYPLGSGPRLVLVDKEYHLPPYSNTTDDAEQNFALPNGYQDIPIKFDPKLMKKDCAGEAEQKQKNKEANIAAYNEMNITYYPFIQKLVSIFNLSKDATLETLATLAENIEVSRHLGHALPPQFTSEDLRNLNHLRAWLYQFEFVGDLAKAKNKYKLQKVLDMFDGRSKNPNQEIRWTALSGHDLDIIPLFTELNISSSACIEELYRKGQTSAVNCEQFPEFASSIIFELHQDQSNFSVRVRVDGKYMNLCEKKSPECSYQEWKDRVKRNLASDALAAQICGSFTKEERAEGQWLKVLREKLD